MSTPPTVSLPQGYLDEYTGFKLVGFASAFTAISICFTALRFIARYKSRTQFGADDYLTIPALLCIVALCAISICG